MQSAGGRNRQAYHPMENGDSGAPYPTCATTNRPNALAVPNPLLMSQAVPAWRMAVFWKSRSVCRRRGLPVSS